MCTLADILTSMRAHMHTHMHIRVHTHTHTCSYLSDMVRMYVHKVCTGRQYNLDLLFLCLPFDSSLCQDLIQLGMSKIGHRKRLLTALQSLPAEDRQPKFKPVSAAGPLHPPVPHSDSPDACSFHSASFHSSMLCLCLLLAGPCVSVAE